MKVLITGAAGFIGSHLAESLVEEGHEVIGLDDLTAGSVENLRAVRDRFTLWKGSVSHALKKLAKKEKFDQVYHLAARIGVGQILNDPRRMLVEHLSDTQAVCWMAVEQRAKLFIPSTSEVYGTGMDLTEDAPLTVGPSQVARSGYAVTKLYAEHMALAFHRQGKLKVTIARLFNVAGARQRNVGGCVLPRFAEAALQGKPVPVHGDGEQTRCFCHVKDCVSAIRKLMETERANGEIVNIGSDFPIAMGMAARDVIRVATEAYGSQSRVEYVPYGKTDPHAGIAWMQARRPNVAKLHDITGLKFQDRWAEIVRDVVDDMAGRLKMGKAEAA